MWPHQLIACIKAGWDAGISTLEGQQQHGELKRAMESAVNAPLSTRDVIAVRATLLAAMRIHAFGDVEYFRMVDKRARRRVVRGGQSISEDMYLSIASVCNFASVDTTRRLPTHPRKQRNPKRNGHRLIETR